MEEKKKSGVGLVIGLLIIIIICLGGYILYSNFYVSDKQPKTEEFESKEEKEEVIVDQQLKKELSIKIADIGMYFHQLPSEKIERFVILRSLLDSMEPVTSVAGIKIDSDTDKSLTNSLSANELNKVSASVVEEKYYDFFGKEIKHGDALEGCPRHYYDSTNKIYYALSGCGGAGDPKLLYFNNKYTKKGNEVYVYVNTGRVDVTTGDVYSDDVDENAQKIETIAFNNVDSYKIDDTNSDKFSEYKFTFVKNEKGKYSFKSVKKVK